jgi:site-specific recombinase XerD
MLGHLVHVIMCYLELEGTFYSNSNEAIHQALNPPQSQEAITHNHTATHLARLTLTNPNHAVAGHTIRHSNALRLRLA